MNSITINKDLVLESGELIKNPTIAYHTYGELNKDKSNVVWICHALTANSDVYDWWEGLVGEKEIINPDEYFIVCANVLGSHYGTTSPLSIDEHTGKPYYHNFPVYTIRDIVSLHIELAAYLSIQDIHLLVGGSMGGHQALEWAIMEPDRIKNLILLATSGTHSPWGVAFNESQRWAIENDGTWKDENDQAGMNGMKVARSFALLSYRNYKTYQVSQQASSEDLLYPDRAGSYQRYQGEKLAKRFNAFSYWHLSKAMDSQNVGRGRGGTAAALKTVKAKTLIITIKGDNLFPIEDQLLLEKNIPESFLSLINSDYGHDGFLIETEKISNEIRWFLRSFSHKKPASAIHNIGLFGFGTVGQQVYEQLNTQPHISIKSIAVKYAYKERGAPKELFTTQPETLLKDPDIDIIIEVIDDAEAAYEYVKKALSNGKTVISANKKMLALHLKELNILAAKHGVNIFYEAAVAAAIPILQILENYYDSEPILSVKGIINGSTNYILHLMEIEQISFEEALKKAQENGFAESDPSLDIDGYDPTYKASLLAFNAFNRYVDPNECERNGISHVTLEDVNNASKLDSRIKLIAEIKRTAKDAVSVTVGPQLISQNDDLYNINAENNAVLVEGKNSGLNLYKGKGAGGVATASAIAADLGLAVRSLMRKRAIEFQLD